MTSKADATVDATVPPWWRLDVRFRTAVRIDGVELRSVPGAGTLDLHLLDGEVNFHPDWFDFPGYGLKDGGIPGAPPRSPIAVLLREIDDVHPIRMPEPEAGSVWTDGEHTLSVLATGKESLTIAVTSEISWPARASLNPVQELDRSVWRALVGDYRLYPMRWAT